jgi:hypothetical protein
VLLNGVCYFGHTVEYMNKAMIRPFTLLSSTPCDIFFVNCGRAASVQQIKSPLWDALLDEYFDCEFRGIPTASLPDVLKTGIDVRPTNSVIWAGTPEKAAEYGPILLALRHDRMKRSFKHLPAQSSRDEIDTARIDFPTMFTLDDGSLFFTRLQETDRRISGASELEYAWWIPGEPLKALRAIFLLGRSEDRPEFERALKGAGCQPHG